MGLIQGAPTALAVLLRAPPLGRGRAGAAVLGVGRSGSATRQEGSLRQPVDHRRRGVCRTDAEKAQEGAM
ncbi:hypothetical protein ACGFYA_16925 [Streptomyces sp. NPDC048305]|uniref:hypothetical protein n=1 Tax=Streptomyces sp. NPDC048305 TaxID=3365532 RepID=UPI003714802C